MRLAAAILASLLVQSAVFGSPTEQHNVAPPSGTAPPETDRRGNIVLGAVLAGGAAVDHGGVGHRQFATLGGHVGRIVAEPRGRFPFRGDFEIAVEVLPVFLVFQETTTYSFASTLLFRHYFSPDKRMRPFLSFGGGALFSTDPVPPQGTSFNFTPQAGLGVAWFREPGLAYLFEYRYVHISNGGLSLPNPGVNSTGVFLGMSVFR